MKEFICKNCGSNEFTKVGNTFICDFCHTEFSVEDTVSSKPENIYQYLQNQKDYERSEAGKEEKRIQGKNVLTAVLAILAVMFAFFILISYNISHAINISFTFALLICVALLIFVIKKFKVKN